MPRRTITKAQLKKLRALLRKLHRSVANAATTNGARKRRKPRKTSTRPHRHNLS